MGIIPGTIVLWVALAVILARQTAALRGRRSGATVIRTVAAGFAFFGVGAALAAGVFADGFGEGGPWSPNATFKVWYGLALVIGGAVVLDVWFGNLRSQRPRPEASAIVPFLVAVGGLIAIFWFWVIQAL